MLLFEKAVAAKRRRDARYKRAEQVLRQVRLRVFDYEDAGKQDKAAKVIRTCQRILGPLWRAQRAAAQDRRLQRTPSAFEPGCCR